MQLIRHLSQILKQNTSKTQGSVLTIGNFDGIHLGHEKILNEVLKIADEKNLQSVILTFEPHPTSFFKADKSKDFRLTTLSQKLKIFREKKIAQAVIMPFNSNFANFSAENFINNILINSLNVKYLIIGYDFTFGKNREGNLQLLEQFAKKHEFNIIKLEAYKNNGEIYSSSLIRNFIKDGKIKEANHALGRNFSLEGIVNCGKKLGRTIGFPTMNIKPKSTAIKPKFGVYKINAIIDKKTYKGIMNFGLRPTIINTLQPIYEIHLFDFNQEIYGQKIRFELLDFIREEKKFQSLDALKQQIIIDITNVKS